MPTPIRGSPPIPLSAAEEAMAAKIRRRGKFYLFLREVRAELFDDAFQAELAAAYHRRGTAPLPAALLALVTALQAYDQVGDAEAVETALTDLRWQLVLDCLGCARAPFSQGALVLSRERMIAHDLDRKLLDRTVALAKRTGRFGWQHLRAALDSSPLIGAGRVQDIWNLLGRALATVATCAARAVGVPRAQVLREAGVTLLVAPSLKAALDIDWDDPAAQADALARLLAEVDRLEQWVAAQPAPQQAQPALRAAVAALHRVLAQDLEPDPTTGQPRLRQEVARDRMPSLGDPEMRHGRKTRSQRFTGYKRHALKLLGPDVIVDALVRPANEPEHHTLATLVPAAQTHGPLAELLLDRGFLPSATVAALHATGTTIRAKAWTSRNGDRYPKSAFTIDLVAQRVTCPAHQTTPMRPGARHVHFPVEGCRACAQRVACTVGRGGRSVAVHPQEALLQELRAAMQTPQGRAALRQRTGIEHSLARVGRMQGPKARYKGTRKNTLDVRRCAAVANLESVARLKAAA